MKFRYFFILFIVFFISGCQSTVITNDANQAFQSVDLPVVEQEDPKSDVSNNFSDKPASLETINKPVDSTSSNLSFNNQQKPEPKIPKFLDYPVPFASQAPFGVWDDLHQEACEEAAMIMAAKYFEKESISPHLMEQAILNLVKWEKENGYQVDSTAEEIVKILTDYFQIKARLVTEVNVENIKKELAAGNLIIVPAAGRKLGNPYFRQPGPIYHMLVIRGYNEKEFITNDPGTKRGEGFKYKYQKLIEAIHDWDHQLAEGGMTDQEIEQGRKVMIVVQN